MWRVKRGVVCGVKREGWVMGQVEDGSGKTIERIRSDGGALEVELL